MLLTAVIALAPAPLLHSQAPPTPPPQPDQASPDAGGPGADSGVIALPKKKDATPDTPPPAPAQPTVKNPEGMATMSLRIDVPEVSVDVGVLLEKTHTFVPGLKPTNFRVYEDGVEQKVVGFKRVEAPITALMICEFAANGRGMNYDMRNTAFAFAQQLRPQDYVALMTFDLRTHIVSDFTQDKRQLFQAIDSLRMPGFSETNVFDALYEGLDRLDRIEGRKYIVLIATGHDSMSKLTLDKILKKVKDSHDITIFTISTGGAQEDARRPRRNGGRNAGYGLSAGPERAEDICGFDRRLELCSALRRRIAGNLPNRQPEHPRQIRTDLPSHQRQAGRYISKAAGATGG
jgi:VWFA-related protein